MLRSVFSWLPLVGAVAGASLASAACSGSARQDLFAGQPGPGGNGDSGSNVNPGLDGGTGADASKPCEGTECQKPTCSDGKTTSISGVVYDPAAQRPLYNVLVYVPKGQPQPLAAGASCTRCGATPPEGAVAITLSDAKGAFRLDDVPAGKDIPLVIQTGKWRRIVTLPNVTACAENPITDKQLTRLPKTHLEGDMPDILIATGACDALECLLRKVGIDDTEFTPPGGGGKVTMIKGNGGGGVPNAPPAQPVWSDVNQLKSYDMTLLACECSEYPENKPQVAKEALRDYVNLGGRVLATHYHYEWLKNGPSDFQGVASWTTNGFGGSTTLYDVDTSFPKGKALGDWLVTVGASNTPGKVQLENVNADVGDVNPQMSLGWISAPPSSGTGRSVKYFSFNTPSAVPPAQQCGRVVFSDIHVASGDQAGGTFPAECTTLSMKPQELALEFMLFDLGSCVMRDSDAPTPPGN